jgi:hypothetical protein
LVVELEPQAPPSAPPTPNAPTNSATMNQSDCDGEREACLVMTSWCPVGAIAINKSA